MGPSRQRIEALTEELATSIAEQKGLELVEVEYVKEHGDYVLRVTIDKPGGVGIDDCQSLSEALSERLDEIDPIPGAYSLEVSSPGLDRPLKKLADFDRFAGRRVQVKTFAPLDGRKNWKGISLGTNGDKAELDVDGKRVALPFDMIAKAHLVPEFEHGRRQDR